MSEEKVLTKEIAEQFLADEDSVDLSEFTTIEEAAAESLSKHESWHLSLDGLTKLSDAAAESLSKFEGSQLSLEGVTELSDNAARSLCKFEGDELIVDLQNIPYSAACILVEAGVVPD